MIPLFDGPKINIKSHKIQLPSSKRVSTVVIFGATMPGLKEFEYGMNIFKHIMLDHEANVRILVKV